MDQEDKIVELLAEIRNNQLEDRQQRVAMQELFLRRQKRALTAVGLIMAGVVAMLVWSIMSH
jgi:CHASE3 domain sensor protein